LELNGFEALAYEKRRGSTDWIFISRGGRAV
jgi:hypothetical protein